MSTEPPSGTAAEVLAWVDDDPQRAQTALEAEQCQDSPRSTLVSKLETIAAKEAPVSEQSTATTTDEEVERDEAQDDAIAEQEELAPEQPSEITLSPADSGTIISTVSVRDTDVEVPDDADLRGEPEVEEQDELEQPEVIEADPVLYMQTASGTYGLILSINGTAYSMTANQAAQLKQAVDKAIVGLAL